LGVLSLSIYWFKEGRRASPESLKGDIKDVFYTKSKRAKKVFMKGGGQILATGSSGPSMEIRPGKLPTGSNSKKVEERGRARHKQKLRVFLGGGPRNLGRGK